MADGRLPLSGPLSHANLVPAATVVANFPMVNADHSKVENYDVTSTLDMRGSLTAHACFDACTGTDGEMSDGPGDRCPRAVILRSTCRARAMNASRAASTNPRGVRRLYATIPQRSRRA